MRALILILIMPLFSGCLSVCNQETYFKPYRLSGEAEVGPWSGDQAIEYAVTDDLIISVQACHESTAMCFIFKPKVEKTIQLTASSVEVLSESGSILDVVDIAHIDYFIYFEFKGSGLVESTSNPDIGVIGPVNGTETSRTSHGYGIEYSFGAHLPFQGVEDNFGPPMLRALFPRHGWREYSFIVKRPEKTGSAFKVRIPDVKIDGKSHEMPVLVFRKVTDRVCYSGV